MDIKNLVLKIKFNYIPYNFSFSFSNYNIYILLRKTSTSTGSSDKTAQESTNNDIVQEEVVGSIPEEDLTDYDNAKVGAEIKGAIPGFYVLIKIII